MRKIRKIVLICMIISAITFVSYAADLNELQEQKQNIQEKIDESTQNLTDVNNELTENLKQIQKLDESIQKAELTLNEVNGRITEKTEELNKIEKNLEKIKKKYDKQKNLLDTRLVAMYETENTNYLDVVLGAKSISDFISSYYLISEITSYDMDLLELVENEKLYIKIK